MDEIISRYDMKIPYTSNIPSCTEFKHKYLNPKKHWAATVVAPQRREWGVAWRLGLSLGEGGRPGAACRGEEGLYVQRQSQRRLYDVA